MRRFGRTLVTAALAVAVVGGTAGWASGESQEAVTGPPPGTAGWRAATASGRALPDPATATPREVARFFAGLDEAACRELLRDHPLVVGNLEGAPVPLRYEANRIAIAATGEARYASSPRRTGGSWPSTRAAGARSPRCSGTWSTRSASR